jgi:hypothetical protein
VFVADYKNGVVAIYNGASGKFIRNLTGFVNPGGLTTDRKDNLYVADSGNAAVKIYAPPYKNTPTTTISDPGEVPSDVAVYNTGMFAIENASDAIGGPGNVLLFAPNTTTPCATATPPIGGQFDKFFFAAFDSKANLFVDATNANGAASVGIVRGMHCAATAQNPNVIEYLRLPNTLGGPGGIAVDKADEIAIADPANQQIDVYPAYSTAANTVPNLGAPSTVTLSGSERPEGIVFDSAATRVSVADAAAGTAEEYGFPGGGAGTKLTNLGQPDGIAQTPAEIPTAPQLIFLTSGTTFTVPNDWNPYNNSIEAIGGGGAGGYAAGGGGGGGAYEKLFNAQLVAGTTVTIAIGAGAVANDLVGGAAGGDTYLCGGTLSCTGITDSGVLIGAQGGGGGSAGGMLGGTGGNTGFGNGTTGFAGGAGGVGDPNLGTNPGGGGGAGGPNGPGGAGGAGTDPGTVYGGAGGGGADGGLAGQPATMAAGGMGGTNLAGTGAGAGGSASAAPGNGTNGGGGGGGGELENPAPGGAGGSGTEFDATHGSGGGGGGGYFFVGGAGGGYGGGGGGGGGGSNANSFGGNGSQGLIVIRYTPV